MDSFFWIAIAVFFVLTAVFIMKKKRSAYGEFSEPLPATAAEVSAVETNETVPDRIVIGQTPSVPIVTIQAFPDVEAFQKAKPMDDHSSKPIGRLNALIQAVPSLLVAGEAHGKKLMEVVINGDLVRAADGNGLRVRVC